MGKKDKVIQQRFKFVFGLTRRTTEDLSSLDF